MSTTGHTEEAEYNGGNGGTERAAALVLGPESSPAEVVAVIAVPTSPKLFLGEVEKCGQ
jgi:hypothetical protein